MVNKTKHLFFKLGLAVPATFFLSVNAFAQDADATEQTEELALEEVIVTGTHIAGIIAGRITRHS